MYNFGFCKQYFYLLAIQCEPPLVPPENGAITCTAGFAFKSECVYTCAVSYKFKSTKTLI